MLIGHVLPGRGEENFCLHFSTMRKNLQQQFLTLSAIKMSEIVTKILPGTIMHMYCTGGGICKVPLNLHVLGSAGGVDY